MRTFRQMAQCSAVFVAVAALAFSQLHAPARAQVITDGTMGPAVALAGPDFAVGADLGTLAGDNLFHSFESFSLGSGQSATFSGPGSVANVISRVTGGQLSSIDGTIRSTIPGADLFLINPAGVVFGPDASLDVQGSFSASTADEITFPDGGRFSVSDPGASVLSVAPPEAFGFLGPTPGAILVDRADLVVPEFKSLSLVGGEIVVRGEGGDVADVPNDLVVRNLLEAPSGEVNIVAAGSVPEIPIGYPLDLSDYSEFGSIRFDDVLVRVNGDADAATPGGAVNIEGGEIVLNNTRIHSDGFGDQQGGDLTFRGFDVTITADRERENGRRHPTVFFAYSNGSGQGGDINFFADEITFEGGVGIFAGNTGSGDSGDISVVARNVNIMSSAVLGTDSFGSGAGGDLTVTTENLFMLSAEGVRYTGLYTDVYGSGDGGTLTVDATTIFLDGTPFFDQPPVPRPGTAAIVSYGSGGPSATGRGGDVTVTADSIRLVGNAQIGSRGTHSAQGGDVYIASPVIDVLDGSAIVALQRGPGPAGNILITTGALTVGATGQYSLEDVGLSGITSTAHEGPVIETPADSGDLTIFADTIDILPGSDFRSIVRREGTGGDITFVATERITVTGDGTAPIPEEIFAPPQDLVGVTFIAAGAQNGGAAGNISLTAPLIIVDAGAAIATNTAGSGPGGTVALNADTLIISGGALVDAGTSSSGPGGDILIDASASVLLTGESTALLVESTSTEPDAGLAGAIFVTTPDLRIEDGALISTDSAVADGGNITIDSAELVYLSSSAITTSVGDGDGGGGNILIAEPVFVVLDAAQILANAHGGPGGNITIVAQNYVESPDSVLDASSDENIDGTITIAAPEVDLSGAVTELSEELLDAAERLAAQCSARGGQTLATFIGRGRSGLPQQPADPVIALYRAPGAVAEGAPRFALLPGRLEIACSG